VPSAEVNVGHAPAVLELIDDFQGHSFWTELLPQLGIGKPAIRHLLLATSSLVETAGFEGIPLDENQVYQTHYSKALREACQSPQIENVLLACLLFACCEFMKGSVPGGLRHVKAGLNIIDEWVKSTTTTDFELSATASMIIQTIGPIFLAYIDKAPTYGMGSVPTNECAVTTLIRGNAELPTVEHFYEIHRAHHALDGIAHHIARLADYRTPLWQPSPPETIKSMLDTWLVHFDKFESSLMSTRRQRFAVALQLLRVHHRMLSIMVNTASSRYEKVYEQFTEDFRWIVSQYENFAETWAKNESLKYFSSPGNIAYHMGFIAPVFFTATKCRDPSIRSGALKQLGSLRVAENNWTSCTAYVIARQMIKIENTRAVNNQRVGSKDERDLIRPVEAFVSDKYNSQAEIDYLAYPYDLSPMMRDSIDLLTCPVTPMAEWVCIVRLCLSRLLTDDDSLCVESSASEGTKVVP
jgi:hypothetical protein